MQHRIGRPDTCSVIAGIMAASVIGAPIVGYGVLGATAVFALHAATYVCIMKPRHADVAQEYTDDKFEVI